VISIGRDRDDGRQRPGAADLAEHADVCTRVDDDRVGVRRNLGRAADSGA
jgi:hypothetical protein